MRKSELSLCEQHIIWSSVALLSLKKRRYLSWFKRHHVLGARSKAPNICLMYVYHTWPRVRTRERNEDAAPVDQVQDKRRDGKKKGPLSQRARVQGRKIKKTLIDLEFSVHPSTKSPYPFPQAVKGLCRDVDWHGPQQLIHTQQSGGSKNVLAILSFKNTDSHRFRHNCQCSSGEEGGKIFNLFSPAIAPQGSIIAGRGWWLDL